ncbi:hypothetical protein PMAYCL1PPCAC_19862, partial [Pristionchus mayeri]
AMAVYNLSRLLGAWPERTNFQRIQVSIKIVFQHEKGTIHNLLQFSTDQLVIKPGPKIAASNLNFSTLLIMTANIREVSIDLICPKLSGMDLSYLRK